MVKTASLRQNESLTESAKAEKAVIDLKRIGMSRDPEKIKVVLKTATEINQGILSKLAITPELASKQQLLSLSQKVSKEISTYQAFNNTLADHKEKIWKGNWITHVLFMAMHAFPKNQPVIHLIESTAVEFKNGTPNIEILKDNLNELKQHRDSGKLSGVMLDFTNLAISQIEAHINFSAVKENPYINIPKHLLVEKLLTPNTGKTANPFDTATYEEAQNEIFLQEAKDKLLFNNNKPMKEQVTEEIVDNLAIAIYKKDDSAINKLLGQLLDEPVKLGHVIIFLNQYDKIGDKVLSTDKYPQLKKALEKNSSWQGALHFNYFITQNVDSKLATRLLEIGKLDTQQSIPTDTWKTLRELPLDQQKFFFAFFPKIKESFVKELTEIQRQIEAKEIKTASDEEKVILVLPLFEGATGISQNEIKQQLFISLPKAYSTVAEEDVITNHPLLVQLMGENPTFKQFIIDKFAEAHVKAKKTTEDIQLATEPSLLRDVQMNALEKLADQIVGPYYQNPTSLPTDFDAQRTRIVAIQQKLPDLKKLGQFLAKMDAVKQSFAEVTEREERLKSITTYDELEKFDRELALKGGVQSPPKEITDLREKIKKQKTALTDLGIIGKSQFPILEKKVRFDEKKVFNDLSARYEKLNSTPHSKELFLEYMELEQEWNSYFGDKSISTDSRDQAHAALMTIALKLVYQATQPAPLDITPYFTNLLNGPFAFPGLEPVKTQFKQNQEQLSPSQK